MSGLRGARGWGWALWVLALGCEPPMDTEALAPEPPGAPGVAEGAPGCPPGRCVLKAGANPGDAVEFTELPVQQQRNDARWGTVLADIVQHLPASYGDTYYDADKVTYGHETTHGINSHLRNHFNRTGKRANGFYVLQNRGVIIVEPAIRKSAAGPFVPAGLRGSRYNLYVAGSPDWDDTPLYLFDEWVAYVNGGEVAVDLHQRGLWDQGSRDGVTGQLEFTVYALALAMAVEQGDPGYFAQNRQFKEFLAWNTKRAMDVYRAGAVMPPFARGEQDAYYERLKTAPEAEALRTFARRVFGAAWADHALFGAPLQGGGPPAGPGDEPARPGEPEDPVQPEEPEDPVQPETPGDSDADGISDAQDLCLDTPAGAPIWRAGEWLGCAAGQPRRLPRLDQGLDGDQDGVKDTDDLCLATAARARVWSSGAWKGCAQGQRRDNLPAVPGDADQDGVADDDDLCRDTPRGRPVWRSGEWLGCAGGQARG